MINILAAEVPQVEAHRAFEILKINGGLQHVEFDSVGCWNLWVVVQVAKPARELRFADTSVAQDKRFQFRVGKLPGS